MVQGKQKGAKIYVSRISQGEHGSLEHPAVVATAFDAYVLST
jgi:hypothetical protein